MRRSRQRNRVLPLVLLVSVLMVPGCGKKGGEPSPPQPVQASKPVQKPASSVRPAVQAQLSTPRRPSVETIDFTRRRDPFKPAIVELAPVARPEPGKKVPDLSLLPIQRYEVERFRVTGIITGLKENRAMIVDPEGKGYVARIGMKIGPNDGRIVRITPQGVEVEESFRDDFGRMKKRTVKLALQRKR